jgi:hypothetical protein
MRHLGKIGLVTVCLGLLVLALSPAHGGPTPQTGSAPVNVTNTPLPVAEVSTAQPLQATVDIVIPDGTFETDLVTGFTVPTGKRLLLRTVAFETQLDSPQQVNVVTVAVTSGNMPVQFPIVSYTQGTIPVFVGGQTVFRTNYAGSEPVNFAAGPGTNVRFQFGRSGASGSKVVKFSVGGYLIDTP